MYLCTVFGAQGTTLWPRAGGPGAGRRYEPYSNRVVRLLCTRDQRPRYRAAEQDIEPTPVNWMCRHLLAPGKQPTPWQELITLAEYVRYWHLADISTAAPNVRFRGYVGDQAHDRGNDQRHQELTHGCGLLITEQRKPVFYVSPRGCWSNVHYWHKADMS